MKTEQKRRRQGKQNILGLALLGFLAAAMTGVRLEPPAHRPARFERRDKEDAMLPKKSPVQAASVDTSKPVPSSITLSKDSVVVGDMLGITVTTTAPVNDVVLVSVSDPARFTPVPNADNPPSLHPWPYKLRFNNSNAASFSVLTNALPATAIEPVGIQVFACQKDADTTLAANRVCALPVSIASAISVLTTHPIPISLQPVPLTTLRYRSRSSRPSLC